MALVDVRSYNLDPNILGNFASGQQFGQQLGQQDRAAQIRGLLAQQQQMQPQTEQQQMLAEQSAGFGTQQAMAEQPRPVMSQDEMIKRARAIDPEQAEKILTSMGLDEPSKRAEFSRFAAQLQSVPYEQRGEMINARAQRLQSEGRDPKETLKLLEVDKTTQDQALIGVQLMDLSTKERFAVQEIEGRRSEEPAGLREFKAKIKGLTPEQQKEATLIELGLSPRAMGSAIQTITDRGIEDEVGAASAVIKQREKFGEMTGASRAKSIDKGFEQIVRINQGIDTIDRAISALEGGAKTGAIQRFLPSMRAASVELENIRNQFALDVIGGVTLGAISEAELALAKQVGLPEGLDEPQLIEHLKQRRTAQEKLRAYYQEQINHLDQGGTVASFLRKKESEQQSSQQPESPTTPQASAPRFLGFE